MMESMHAGQYGFDGSHEFKITNVSGPEVEIEYLSDGTRMWVQSNRLERNGEEWELR